MLFRSLFAIMIAMIAFSSVSQAQYRDHSRRRPLLQRTNRILGVWQGNGRHWRTPGHDSSYYNPWSAHNSALVSQGYEPNTYQGQGQFYVPAPSTQFGTDPFYQPQQQPTPRVPTPTNAPLGGSYEPFGEKDVDEKVPEIEPVEGQPATKKAPQEIDPLPSQENLSSLELPLDNFQEVLPVQATPIQTTPIQRQQSSSIQWDEIDFE